LTKLGTCLDRKRVWNPVDFQGQCHRVNFFDPIILTLEINRVPDPLKDEICTKFGKNPLKDVDPRVFTRIATDGSVTIYPRNFVDEGITKNFFHITSL
jgi:hypothetical protein